MALNWHIHLHHTQHTHHALHTPYQWFCGSDMNDVFNFSVGSQQLLHRWLRTIMEGALLSALFFLLLWPISIAIVAPIWDGKNMAGGWAPEAIKGVYGAVLGLLMNPVCAMIGLGAEDAVGRRRLGELEEGLGAVVEGCPHCQEGKGRVPAPAPARAETAVQVTPPEPEQAGTLPQAPAEVPPAPTEGPEAAAAQPPLSQAAPIEQTPTEQPSTEHLPAQELEPQVVTQLVRAEAEEQLELPAPSAQPEQTEEQSSDAGGVPMGL